MSQQNNLFNAPYSCMNNIDAILYINLEHRKDRLEHIQTEIKKINPDLSKAHRIDAVKENIGALGCTLSHIKAHKLFISNPTWNTCLILEDDFTFTSDNSLSIHKNLNYIFNNVKDFDVILLSKGLHDYRDEDTEFPSIKRVLSSQTASGYIVSKKYIFSLVANFIMASNLMKREGWRSEYCLDQYWKPLQPYGKWYTFEKRLGFQYANHSDIEHTYCEYNC